MKKLCTLSALLFFYSFILFSDDNSSSAVTGSAAYVSERFSLPAPESVTALTKVSGGVEDALWEKLPESLLTLNRGDEKIKVKIKNCRSSDRIFFLIKVPVQSLVRKHEVWHWDKDQQLYKPSKEVETSLTLFFFKDEHADRADVWIWRAARTDAAKCADDMFFKDGSFSMDEGKSCWFSKFFGEFAGAELPRFFQRTPEGSAADVRAKGDMKDGILTLKFSRRRNTGNKDDFVLNDKLFMKMIFQPGNQ